MFINLTGHEVTDANTGKVIPADGIIRAEAESCKLFRMQGIPVFTSFIQPLDSLPDPVQGVIYIVSNLYLNTCRGRTDVVAPGKVVRVDGKAVACRGFRANIAFEAWYDRVKDRLPNVSLEDTYQIWCLSL